MPQINLDSWILERAEKGEQVVSVDGITPDGLQVLIIVAVGVNAGLLKRRLFDTGVLRVESVEKHEPDGG